MIDPNEIEKRFDPVPHMSDEQGEVLISLNFDFKALAHSINNGCADGREKSLAMTKLEEALLWTKLSILKNPEYYTPVKSTGPSTAAATISATATVKKANQP